MRVFIISDTHFGDQFLETNDLRPKGIMHKIVKNWKNVITHDDLVIHLGDIILGKMSDYKDLIKELPGRKILVIGNHDKKGLNWYMNNGFHFACHSFTWEYLGKKLVFTHEPIQNEFEEDINIHGHLHLGLHRKEYVLNEKHCLFSLEEEHYQPVLLQTFLKKKGF